MPRANKTKKEIVEDLKAKQESERKRKLIRDIIYPMVLELEPKTIRYAKVFLYTSSTALEQAFMKEKTTRTVGEFIPALKEMFKDGEAKEYFRLFELLKDESVSSFQAMIKDLPQNIDNFFYQKMEKESVDQIDIDKILG